MHRILALDPGLPDCGAALYEDGVLVGAVGPAVAIPVVPCPLCGPRRCDHQHGHARALTALCDAVEVALGVGVGGLKVDVAVSEWPQIWHHHGQIAPRTVQPLLDLAAVAGALLDRLEAQGAACYRVTPQQWKGSTPKPQHQRLGLARLTPQERDRLPRMARAGRYLSDPLDAALLGLWWLERTGARPLVMHGRPQDFLGLLEDNG